MRGESEYLVNYLNLIVESSGPSNCLGKATSQEIASALFSGIGKERKGVLLR